MELSLTVEEGKETIEVVALIKYLGRPLEQSDDDFSEVRRNIRKARHFWGRLRVILRRYEAEPITSAVFYKAVVQAVLLFSAETWVFSAAMDKHIAGGHKFFFVAGDGEMVKEATIWDLEVGRGR